jgi:GTPase SAR1 family protein
MVRITKDKNIYIKILYWGCATSGKTTAVDTLYNICREQDKDVVPTGNLVKIDMSSGATLYFDRGIFQSKKQKNIYFHCYTVAGQTRFQPLRKKVFMGTDGVIFVADSQRSRLQDNIDSLKELKRVAGEELIKKIPMLVMLNKRDLDDLLTIDEWESLMRDEGLLYERKHPLFDWNPIIYETVALYDINKNIYRIFSELSRRCVMYQVYGNGDAPDKKPPSLPPDVPEL